MRRFIRLGLFGLTAFVAGAATSVAVAGDGPYDLVKQLARVLVLIENDYVDPVSRARLLQGAIKGMVAELDPHSSFLPAEDYKIFEADTKGEFGGIGVEVDFQNETVVVIAPIEGSPADRAGIVPGDRIVAIDGAPVRGQSMQDLVRRMRGKPGTKVVVSINRDPPEGATAAASEKVTHLTLLREVIQVASVASKLLDGNVAYVRIKQFQSGTHDELVAAVGKLRTEARAAFSGVILDLRNDPGGLVDEASAVADEFLDGGVIYTTRHRGVTVDEVSAGGGGALTRERAVVLLNEFSASAAELVAGALQDHKRATVVGARSFGKGSVQTIIDLPSGSGLRLTTMRYYTPRGHAIQAQGVTPDVEVASALGASKLFGIMRESSLENHLPAEGIALEPKTLTPAAPPIAAADAGAPAQNVYLGVARNVPKDPTTGPDTALSVAYKMLRGIPR
jgi:carboxyl-terminal processing protease